MTNSDSFIKRIKEEKIRPIPRWRFTSRNALIWTLVLLTIILGALAFSIILFVTQQIEFDLIAHMAHSRVEMWLGLLPFIWIIMLIISLLISVFGLKKTRKGYKYPVSRLVAGNVIFSILLGTLLFLGGGARWLENSFDVNMAFYEGVNDKKIKMWSKPNDGYLSGTIQQVFEYSIKLVDHNNTTWEVDITDAKLFTMVEMKEGEKVKLVGAVTSDGHFRADEVRPWGGFGPQRMRQGPSK